MNRTNTSMMQVASLKPELEFEVLKLVLLRESYIQRLTKKLEKDNGVVDMSVIGLFDVLRGVSIDIVETIKYWETSQVDYPLVKPFKWNGENYLVKMVDDLNFVSQYERVVGWLGFEVQSNPFLVPTEVLSDGTALAKTSYIVFGTRPDIPKTKISRAKTKGKYIKSPYVTPIINDADVIPSLSIANKLNRLDRVKAKANARAVQIKLDVDSMGDADPFETFVSAEVVDRIKRCWKQLCVVNPSLEPSSYREAMNVIQTMEWSTSGLSDNESNMGDGTAKLGETTISWADTMPERQSLQQYVGTDSDSFRAALNQTAHVSPMRTNSALRTTSLAKQTPKTHVWTPHEITLQRVVHKRGGELYVLTAAATQGRTIAPTRRSRFERLEWDLEQTRRQHEALVLSLGAVHEPTKALVSGEVEQGTDVKSSSALRLPWDTATDEMMSGASEESKEAQHKQQPRLQVNTVDIPSGAAMNATDNVLRGDLCAPTPHVAVVEELAVESTRSTAGDMKIHVEMQLTFMQYQYDHFKIISQGNVAGLEKRRNMRPLRDGEALECDEKLSMSLEDAMATRIQRKVRIKFGRILRIALKRARNRAATRIQTRWRTFKAKMGSSVYFSKLQLAMMLQKLYRGCGGKEITARLKRRAEERQAARNIQRLFRGSQGRKRSKLKREFLSRIAQANELVSLKELIPADVEELSDAIEFFIKDYSLDLPESVLTVLRCILYMFKGSDAEMVRVENAGYIENKYVRAKTATWPKILLFLRRKGKLLRKLRALVGQAHIPDPRPLVFTTECMVHVNITVVGVAESDFGQMKLGRKCIVTMFKYIQCIQRIYQLQSAFPEYFSPGQPRWFRKIVKLRTSYDTSISRFRIENQCQIRLFQIRRELIQQGLKWRCIAAAIKSNDAALNTAKADAAKLGKRLTIFVKNLEDTVAVRIKVMENLERTRMLGVDIARGKLKEYMDSVIAPDEKRLKELYHLVDEKALDLLTTTSRKISTMAQIVQDRKSRDFDSIVNFEDVHQACDDLGGVLANLIFLSENWMEFLTSIGGIQFIADLVGEKKEYFVKTRDEALRLMQRRRDLIAFIERGFMREFAKVYRLALEAKQALINQPWDQPQEVELEAETIENEECATREADLTRKQRRHVDNIEIPSAPWTPVLVLVDTRLPRLWKNMFIAKMENFTFMVCGKAQGDPHLLTEIQANFDKNLNSIIFVDRGVDKIARGNYIACLNSLIYGLIPRPRVLSIDSTVSFRGGGWHSLAPLDREAVLINENGQVALSVAKLRAIHRQIGDGLLSGDTNSLSSRSAPGDEGRHEGLSAGFAHQELKSKFRQDFEYFLQTLQTAEKEKHGATESPYKVIAATIACLFGVWESPMYKWTSRQIEDGSVHFVEKISNVHTFLQLIDLTTLPSCDAECLRKLTLARNFDVCWKYFSSVDFYAHPFLFLLGQWCMELMNCIDRLGAQGGPSNDSYRNEFVAYTRYIDWDDDVLEVTRSDDMDLIVGDILTHALEPSKIFDSNNHPVPVYAKKFMEDTEKEVMAFNRLSCPVRIYYCGKRVFVSVETQRNESSKLCRYFSTTNAEEVVKMTFPNGTEIFEGKIKKYPLDLGDATVGVGAAQKWYNLLASWVRIEDFESTFQPTLIRVRSLLFSKIGMLNGYFVRLEVYEEKFGDIAILVHIAGQGSKCFKVSADNMKILLAVADSREEKPKIDAMETPSIATFYANRLEILPTKMFSDFLAEGELLPKSIVRGLRVKMRTTRGPGRYAGSKLLSVQGVSLVISVFELQNDTDAHALRISIYHKATSQTVEYRISNMERLALFPEQSKPVLEQILQRLRIVKCDVTQSSRTLLILGDKFTPKERIFFVDGRDEFDIRSPDDDDHFVLGEEDDVSIENVSGKWTWALYFNRTVVHSKRGNLLISIGMSLPLIGFSVFVLDERTHKEAYRLISFVDSCMVIKRSVEELFEDIKVLDETILFDILDDMLGMEVVLQDKFGRHALHFKGEEQSGPSILIAHLRPHIFTAAETAEVRDSRLQFTVPSQRIKINVISAHYLAFLGMFGMRLVSNDAQDNSLICRVVRNPYCVVKWNMRELGKTSVAEKTISPDFDPEDSTFAIKTLRGQEIKNCVLEVEVYDADILHSKGDFLGCVRLTGEPLVRFLDDGTKGRSTTLKMGPSLKLTSLENKFAQGSLVLSGVLVDAVEAREAKEEANAGEENLAKPTDAGVGAITSLLTGSIRSRFGGLFGHKSKTKANTNEQQAQDSAVKEDERSFQQLDGVVESQSLLEGGSQTKTHDDEMTISTDKQILTPEIDDSTVVSSIGNSNVVVGNKDILAVQSAAIVLNVLGVDALLGSTLIFKLNGVQFGHLKTEYSTALNMVLQVPLPARHRVTDCALEIEAYTTALGTGHENILLAAAVFRGNDLADLLKEMTSTGNPQWVNFLFSMNALPQDIVATSSSSMYMGRIQLSGYVCEQAFLENERDILTIVLFSLHNLSRTVKVAAECVRISFNDDVVGEVSIPTGVGYETHPVWEEPPHFHIKILPRLHLEMCNLRVDLVERKTKRIVSTRSFVGSELVQFLHTDHDESHMYLLGDESSHALEVDGPDQHKRSRHINVAASAQISMKGSIVQHHDEAALKRSMDSLFYGHGLLSEIQNSPMKTLELFAISFQPASSLHNPPRRAFFKVYFNNKLLGKKIYATCTPCSKKECLHQQKLVAQVPSGFKIQDCRITILVYDSPEESDSSYLGFVELTNQQLKDMMKRGQYDATVSFDLFKPNQPRGDCNRIELLCDAEIGDADNDIDHHADSIALKLSTLVVEDGLSSRDCVNDVRIAVWWNGKEVMSGLKLNTLDSDGFAVDDRSAAVTGLDPRMPQQVSGQALRLTAPDSYEIADCRLELRLIEAGHPISRAIGGWCVDGDDLKNLIGTSRWADITTTWLNGHQNINVEAPKRGSEGEGGALKGEGQFTNDVGNGNVDSNEDKQDTNFILNNQENLLLARVQFEMLLHVPERQNNERKKPMKLVATDKGAILVISSKLDSFMTGWRNIFPDEGYQDTAAGKEGMKDSAPPEIPINTFPSVKLKTEVPAIEYFKASKEEEEERVCWRGRVMPHHFIANEEETSAIMMSRSSKLIASKSIRDMQVLAETRYLKEYSGASEEISYQLPICVREVVTDGPGLVRRMYRIEVSANNGVLMGYADIIDDDDMRRVVGLDGSDLVGGQRNEWDLPKIFEYIVRERMTLDMLPAGKTTQKKKTYTRDGQWIKSETQVITGSLITLMRDEVPVTSLDDSNLSLTDASSVVLDKDALEEPDKRFWIRIYTKTHRLCGQLLRTLVLIEGDVEELYTQPNAFFKAFDTNNFMASKLALSNLMIKFRSKNCITRVTHDLRMSGDEILRWLPDFFPLDLTSKFRRAMFGRFLFDNLLIKYNNRGGYDLDLINADTVKLMNQQEEVEKEEEEEAVPSSLENDEEDEASSQSQFKVKSGFVQSLKNFTQQFNLRDVATGILSKLSDLINLPR